MKGSFEDRFEAFKERHLLTGIDLVLGGIAVVGLLSLIVVHILIRV